MTFNGLYFVLWHIKLWIKYFKLVLNSVKVFKNLNRCSGIENIVNGKNNNNRPFVVSTTLAIAFTINGMWL